MTYVRLNHLSMKYLNRTCFFFTPKLQFMIVATCIRTFDIYFTMNEYAQHLFLPPKSYCRLRISTYYGHPMRAFFQIFQISWLIGQIGRISFEVFQGIFGSTICSNFVTVYTQSVILHLTGFSIQDWHMFLGCTEFGIQ